MKLIHCVSIFVILPVDLMSMKICKKKLYINFKLVTPTNTPISLDLILNNVFFIIV